MNIEILTPSGFQKFDGIAKWKHDEKCRVIFEDNTTIECSLLHKFVYDECKEVYAQNVKIGDMIGGKSVIQIDFLNITDMMYDPCNVRGGSVYYHDDFIPSTQTFFGTGDTLIDGETLMKLRAKPPLYTQGSMKVFEEAKEGHEYMICADVAKGLGKDYSTFNIIDITQKPFNQVGVYRNNKIAPLLFPDEIYKWAKAYNDAYVVVENNDAGQVVVNGLYHDLEYENMHLESVTKGKLGVYMDKKVKRLGCSGFKEILESGGLEVHDEETIIEISTFEAKGNSFEASDGNHDDLVMNLVMFGFFVNTRFFSNMTDINLRQFLHEQRILEIENDVVPFGIIENGLEAEEEDVVLPGPEWSIAKPDEDPWESWEGSSIW